MGADNGIGRATVEAFDAEGVQGVLADIDAAALDDALGLRRQGAEVEAAAVVDVDHGSVTNLAAAVGCPLVCSTRRRTTHAS